MAKLPPSSGSLRAHASTASKARPHGAFTTSVPTVKKGTFTGDDDSSDSSSSSDSDSDSDAETKNETSSDFLKKLSTPSSRGKANGASAKHDAKSSKTATPAKSPTVNGLGAAAVKKEDKTSAKQVKKEDTSSESESGSDSDSSSDEKTKKTEKTKKAGSKAGKIKTVAAESKKVKKSESSSESSSGSDTSSTSDSESESESDKADKSKSKSKTPAKSVSKTKSHEREESKKAAAKSKSPVKKASTSESDSASSESGSESESESEDPSQQIAEQLKNDVNSSKSQSSKAQPTSAQPSSEKPSKKKAKLTKPPVEGEDSDVEMMDQSLALTNGGVPTNVGDVPEFVVPDFHLRKLEGDSNAAEVSKFFSKAQLEGKQVWYITAPASVPVTVVQDSTIPMDKAQQGLSVLSHNGDDYRMVFDNPAASSSFRLLIPSKKGNEYSLLERQVDQTMHFTRSETFGPDGPSNVITTKTISTIKPARPQPEGLRARYTPLGVPAPKPTIVHINKALASVAAEAATSTPSSGSSKKKRKHTDDGEDGSVSTTTPATITTPVSAATKAAAVPSSNKKNPPAEKSAKKQKTSSHDTPRKRTPVPLPQHGSRSNSTTSANSAPLGRSKMSASPGAAIPVTQVPLPAKYTQVSLPSFPVPSSSAVTGGTQFSSPAANKDAEKLAKKAEKDRKKAAKEAEKDRKKAEKEVEKERKKAEKEAAKAAARSRGIANQSQIAPPRPWENH